jgi:hypothetical protein
MLIIGCDLHSRYQQIAVMDDSTVESIERRLDHQNGEANNFYRSKALDPRLLLASGDVDPHTPSPCQSFAFPASLLRGKRAQFFGQIHAQPLQTHTT